MNEKNIALNDAEITKIIREAGVPLHLKGFRYLKIAISMVAEDDDILGAVTKELYPAIAKKNNTSSCGVERAIRNAIDAAWNKSKSESIEELFYLNARKPTNSEFIRVVFEKLKVNYQISL